MDALWRPPETQRIWTFCDVENVGSQRVLEKMGLSSLNSAKISELKAPMPGMVLKVFVNEGDEIKKGENLFVLEAMKMENIIKAPRDAVIKTVKIKPGDKVEKGQILLQFN